MADEMDDRLDFFGQAMELAEKKFGASFDDDDNERVLNALYDEFRKLAKGTKAKAWLLKKLPDVFRYTEGAPKWFGDSPEWPFADGKPMVFVGQLEVKSGAVSIRELIAQNRLYVFAARVKDTDGWRIDYKVVERDSEFKDLVALSDEEGNITGIAKKPKS